MIDLHSHSTMSDGTDSPTRVVQLAGGGVERARNLDLVTRPKA